MVMLLRSTVRARMAGTAAWVLLGLAAISSEAFVRADEQGKRGDPAAPSTPIEPAGVKGEFTLVSAGDLIIERPMSASPNPGFQQLLSILRGGDVTIGNMEGVFFDAATFKGYSPGPPYNLRGEAAVARDLNAMGFDMVSTANNHSNDWDIDGLLAMRKLLDEAGVVHAGDGLTLADARAAKYFDTPKGRVALVATASTFKIGAQAADAIDALPARPGISTLRLREIQVVTPETFKHLHSAGARMTPGGDLTFAWNTPFAQQFEKVFREGLQSEYRYEMNTFDRHAILQAIREAQLNADLTVFTIHAHENADGMDDREMGDPANFLVELSHEVIDAGADVVMGGGPHSMRGIEIYKGKPIFYGLAVFIFRGDVVRNQFEQTEQYGAKTAQPPAASDAPSSWNDSFFATTRFVDGVVKEIRLFPLDHERNLPKTRRAPVRLASSERARQILEDLQQYSRRFGTTIDVEGTVGVLRF